MPRSTQRSLVLSVSLRAGCYRHIQINEGVTLYTLHSVILDAFGFDDDHMHAFFMNNYAWDSSAEFVSPYSELDDARGFSDKVKLSKFQFEKGDKFLYIFDFGDDWRFRIKVLHVIEEPTPVANILKSVGWISQYGDEDEDL